MLDKLIEEEQELQEEVFVKTIKRKAKGDYITFYYQLLEIINVECDQNEEDSSLMGFETDER